MSGGGDKKFSSKQMTFFANFERIFVSFIIAKNASASQGEEATGLEKELLKVFCLFTKGLCTHDEEFANTRRIRRICLHPRFLKNIKFAKANQQV